MPVIYPGNMPNLQPSQLREQEKAPTRPRAPTAPLRPAEPTLSASNMEQATLMALLDHIGRLTGVVEKMSTNIVVLNEDLRVTTQKVDELLARDRHSFAIEMTEQREGGMQGLGPPSDRPGGKKSKFEGRVDAEAGDDEGEDMWDDSELDEAAAQTLLAKIMRADTHGTPKALDHEGNVRFREGRGTILGSSLDTAHGQATIIPPSAQTQRDHAMKSQPAPKCTSTPAAQPSDPQRKRSLSTIANQPEHDIRPAQRASSTSAKSYSDWEGLSDTPVTAPPAKRARVSVDVLPSVPREKKAEASLSASQGAVNDTSKERRVHEGKEEPKSTDEIGASKRSAQKNKKKKKKAQNSIPEGVMNEKDALPIEEVVKQAQSAAEHLQGRRKQR